MSVLYNTSEYALPNDISITTGNADGWVLVSRDTSANTPEPAAPTARRVSEPAAKPAARSRKPKR